MNEQIKNQADNTLIELKTTKRGLAKKYVSSCITIVITILAAFILISLLTNWKEGIYEKYNVNSYKEFEALTTYSPGKYDDDTKLAAFSVLIFALKIAFVIIVPCSLWNIFVTNTYWAKEINIIDKKSGKITCYKYCFPYRKTVHELMFHRIIKVDVFQNSFSRVLNTGTLELEILTTMTADTEVSTWDIPCIEDPYQAKARILENLPKFSPVKIEEVKTLS